MRKLATLIAIFGLALPGFAADDDCAGWLKGESTRSGGAEQTCVITSTFTNVPEGTVVERSLSFANSPSVRLLRVEVRSTNANTTGLVPSDISIQTVTGANGGTLIYNSSNCISVTPETGGAVYTCYINEIVDIGASTTVAGGERRLYIRVANNDAEVTNDEDYVVTTVWGS